MGSIETTQLENSALIITADHDLSIKSWPLTLPAKKGQVVIPSGNVLMKIKATGICGSDVSHPSILTMGSYQERWLTQVLSQIHFWKDGRAGSGVVTKPFAVGHECAGEVAAVADDVVDWTLGDRAVIKPSGPCLK
jgi:threonine dehydrogenase-like Zn-dependent dehydrogenase